MPDITVKMQERAHVLVVTKMARYYCQSGLDRVAAERIRQVEEEGFTPEHDLSEYGQSTLVLAGIAYLDYAAAQLKGESGFEDDIPSSWPFDLTWWKPSDDPERNLEKGGALVVAALDRIIVGSEVEG